MAITYSTPIPVTQTYPVADAQALTLYSLVKLSGGNVVPMAAATDDCLGICGTRKSANDGQTTCEVYPMGGDAVFEVDLDAASTWVVGDTFAFSSATSMTKSTANPIARAVNSGTSKSRARVKLIGNTAETALRLTALTIGSGTPGGGTVNVGATNTSDVSGAINNNFATLATRINAIAAAIGLD
jgi:hypothetical protein